MRFRDGGLRFGRDRLPSGAFEDDGVDDPLRSRRELRDRAWNLLRRGRRPSGASRGDEARALLSPRHRLSVEANALTATGLYAYGGTDGLELLISWYDDTAGGSFASERVDLAATDDGWERIRRCFEPPDDAEYVDVFVFLDPPEPGDRTARFDDLRLIEWAEPGAESGREYDPLLLDGSAETDLQTVRFDAGSNAETDAVDVEWQRLAE